MASMATELSMMCAVCAALRQVLSRGLHLMGRSTHLECCLLHPCNNGPELMDLRYLFLQLLGCGLHGLALFLGRNERQGIVEHTVERIGHGAQFILKED